MTTRHLIKRHGVYPPMSEELSKAVEEAKRLLTSEGLDRFHRATKVWFDSELNKFEFEDRDV